VFNDGRLVRSGATVTIDEVDDGGPLQVQVDDEPAEFGSAGKAVFADLARQYAARYKVKPRRAEDLRDAVHVQERPLNDAAGD
jgi:hypothetical protein